MSLHSLDLGWGAIFVVTAVLVGTTIEVAGPLVLIWTAMLVNELATFKSRRYGQTYICVAGDELAHVNI
jgi:hypothetical protein